MSDATGGRTTRDWVVDTVLFLLAASVGVIAAFRRVNLPDAPVWVLYADWAMGALGCVALWWRRRFPVVLATVLIAASVFSEAASGPAVFALFTVAVHGSTRATAVLCAASVVALSAYQLLRPEPMAPPLMVFTAIVLGHIAVVAWGMSVRSRRELVASLRERAAAAEVEARLRAERSQHEAREALAREMHDVLGHRLSLVSVHAGALSYYREASADEVARVAEVLRENAHRALQDLREVIGVLRAPVGELPLPVVEDVLELIDEATQAGTAVDLRDETGVTTGGGTLPATQGRTLYRVVQESLTNVRKHAPDAAVVVHITGQPGEHLIAEIVNTRSTQAQSPGSSGEGLRGLAERARLVAGRLDYGPTASGGWRVRMWLPWPT
ncbi:sensor histidine kinase [Amycolatopsis sp. 195334CR]|uniref:sensor histidine kinase n=1 Tax=Amycolatopsis sp. 195334CR TaxID=2814588 RepID=UPI001A8DDE24|nr:histidine kinase [Amycolatopsis sp. 195334CR]MBN6041171.1 sensor histidine kinase [Amycolatopsis sp. 195334CR]